MVVQRPHVESASVPYDSKQAESDLFGPGQAPDGALVLTDLVGVRPIFIQAKELEGKITKLAAGLNRSLNVNIDPELNDLYGAISGLLKYEELSDLCGGLLDLIAEMTNGSPFFNLAADRAGEYGAYAISSSGEGEKQQLMEERGEFYQIYRNAITKYWGETLSTMFSEMKSFLVSMREQYSGELQQAVDGMIATVEKTAGMSKKFKIIEEISSVSVGIVDLMGELDALYGNSLALSANNSRLMATNKELMVRVGALQERLGPEIARRQQLEMRELALGFERYVGDKVIDLMVSGPEKESIMGELLKGQGMKVADLMNGIGEMIADVFKDNSLRLVLKKIDPLRLGSLLSFVEKDGIGVLDEAALMKAFPGVPDFQDRNLRLIFIEAVGEFLEKRQEDLRRDVGKLPARSSRLVTPHVSPVGGRAAVPPLSVASGQKFIGDPGLEFKLDLEETTPTQSSQSAVVGEVSTSPTDQNPTFGNTYEIQKAKWPDSTIAQMFDLSAVNMLNRHNETGLYLVPRRAAGVKPDLSDIPLLREAFGQPAGDPQYQILMEQRLRDDVVAVIPVDTVELGVHQADIAVNLRSVAALRDGETEHPVIGEVMYVEGLNLMMLFASNRFEGDLGRFIEEVRERRQNALAEARFLNGQVMGVNLAVAKGIVNGGEVFISEMYKQFGPSDVEVIDVHKSATPAEGSPAVQQVIAASKSNHAAQSDSQEIAAGQRETLTKD